MFKVGDKVVCMSESMSGFHESRLHHIYKIDFISTGDEYFYGYDINDNPINRFSSLCESKHFILLTDLRKQKLDKLYQRIKHHRYVRK